MIFLPNKFLRYTAALRSCIQLSVIKQGLNKKHLNNLRKIYNAEALLTDEPAIPINLWQYLSVLLTSVYIIKNEKGLPFVFKIDITENCLIYLKPFTALILNLCTNADGIEILNKNGNLIIKTDTKKTKYSQKITSKLKGCIYYEIKSGKMLVSLPFTATDKKPANTPYTTEEYILNPFSAVNIFI